MNSPNFDGQIKLEEALKKSEEKYRYLYNESQVFNIIVNLDGTIKDVNKFVINKLKYSKEEIIGKSVTNFVIEDQKEKIKETSFIELRVYDALGRFIKLVDEGIKIPGSYTVKFEAENLSTGVYFYQLISGEYQTQNKMLLLK